MEMFNKAVNEWHLKNREGKYDVSHALIKVFIIILRILIVGGIDLCRGKRYFHLRTLLKCRFLIQ